MPGYDQAGPLIANYDKLASGFDRIVLGVRACDKKGISRSGRIKMGRFHPGELIRENTHRRQVNLATALPTTIRRAAGGYPTAIVGLPV